MGTRDVGPMPAALGGRLVVGEYLPLGSDCVTYVMVRPCMSPRPGVLGTMK